MLIHNKDELNAILLQKTRNALIKMQGRVYNIINRFVKEYYTEYNPIMYKRHYQFYCSLVKSEIVPVGNGQLGWKASVYFDANRLDYYMKSFKGELSKEQKIKLNIPIDEPPDVVVDRAPVGGYNTVINVENMRGIPDNLETGEKVLHRILKEKLHVKYPYIKTAVPIWDNSISILNRDGFNMLKKMLKDEGVPIK